MDRRESMSVSELAHLAGNLKERLEENADAPESVAGLLLEARVVTGVLAEELSRMAASEESEPAEGHQSERLAG